MIIINEHPHSVFCGVIVCHSVDRIFNADSNAGKYMKTYISMVAALAEVG